MRASRGRKRRLELPCLLWEWEEEEEDGAPVPGRPHKAGCSSSAPLNSTQQPKHSTRLRTSIHSGSTRTNPLHASLLLLGIRNFITTLKIAKIEGILHSM